MIERAKINAFMSRNEANVLGSVLGVIMGTGFGYLLFLVVRAFITLAK